MTRFNHNKGSTAKPRRKTALALIFALLVLIAGSAVIVRQAYESNLKPVSASTEGVVITIKPGSSPGQIGEQLKQKGIIKSDWALEWYVRTTICATS